MIKLPKDDDFLAIDEATLDREWVEQPRLFFKYARRLADAQQARDDAAAELDLVKANLELEIREDFKPYGLKKVTDSGVKAIIPKQPEYQNALKELNECKRAVGVLQAAVTALEHRKRALEKLVDLVSMDYFATPRASEGTKDAMREVVKRSVRRRGQRKDGPD